MRPRRSLFEFVGFFFRRAPRPYVAWAAVDYRSARYLYRAQNIIWVWLGVAAVLGALAWLLRPSLGPVVVSHSWLIDAIRNGLLCYGGLLIAIGVWWIRRELEVFGHVLFAVGAGITALVTATASVPGSVFLPAALTGGLTVASVFRAIYLVRWIGAVHGTDTSG